MSIISQLKEQLGKKSVAVSLKKGVAMTVASATLIAASTSAMNLTQASDLVHEHAKAVNNEANLAAKILKIDQSELVNKNYLKLAERIDAYLTGETTDLVIDASMLDEIRSQNHSDAETETDTETATSQSVPDDEAESQAITAITSRMPDRTTPEFDSDGPAQSASTTFDVQSQLSQALNDKSSNNPNLAKAVSDLKSAVKNHGKTSNVADSIVAHKSAAAEPKPTKTGTDVSNASPQSSNVSQSKHNSVVQPEKPKSDRSASDNKTTTAKESSHTGMNRSNRKEETISGKFVIHVKRQYVNHRLIDEFDIVKTTRGIRHADGTETWESVTFTASDLSPDQLTATSLSGLHRLAQPQFSMTYTPTSSSQEVSQIIQYGKAEKIDEHIEQTENVTRTIRLIKEDGSELQRMIQKSGEDIQIPQTIDDLYTTQQNLTMPFEQSDVDIVYHPINSRITKSESYTVKDIDQSGIEIRSEIRSVDVAYDRNNMTQTDTKDVKSVEAQITKDEIEGYVAHSIRFDHERNEVIRSYTKLPVVEEPRSSSTTTIEPTADQIYSSAVSMLESMPTLSNRAEYSYSTELNDAI